MTFDHCRLLLLAATLALSACGNSVGLDTVTSKAAEDQASFGCEGFPRTDSNGDVTICEAREFSDLSTSGSLTIRESYAEYSGVNGPIITVNPVGSVASSSIRAVGTAVSTITLRAYIYASGRDEAAAQATAASVEIHTDNDDFYATGPNRSDGTVRPNRASNWIVSFDAELPHDSNLTVQSGYGPVIAQDLAGALTLASDYGLLELTRLSGTVNGNSDFGAISATDLDGDISLVSSSGTIEVARATGTIVLDSNTGQILASELDGDSRLTTSSGTVQLTGARGTIAADVNAGLLQAEGLDGDISFDSSSADVKLGGISGFLSGQTSSGNIELDLAGTSWAGDGAELSSSSGNITLLAPTDYSAVFEFTTTSGNIRSDFSGNSFGGQAHYTEITGQGGASLTAETSSGDITLVKKQ